MVLLAYSRQLAIFETAEMLWGLPHMAMGTALNGMWHFPAPCGHRAQTPYACCALISQLWLVEVVSEQAPPF